MGAPFLLGPLLFPTSRVEPSDRSLTALQAALRKVAWGSVSAVLVKYASRRARSNVLGEELMRKVIAEVIDPERSHWDPEKEPDIVRYLIGRIDGALAVERRKEKLRASPHVVARIEQEFTQAVPTPEDVLDARQRGEGYAALWGRLRSGFETSGDDLALKVIAQYEDGRSDAAEQARRIGAEQRDVVAARRRIARRARALRDGEDGPDEDEEFVARAADADGGGQ